MLAAELSLEGLLEALTTGTDHRDLAPYDEARPDAHARATRYVLAVLEAKTRDHLARCQRHLTVCGQVDR